MTEKERSKRPETLLDTTGYMAEMRAPVEMMVKVKPEVLDVIGPGNPRAYNTQLSVSFLLFEETKAVLSEPFMEIFTFFGPLQNLSELLQFFAFESKE